MTRAGIMIVAASLFAASTTPRTDADTTTIGASQDNTIYSNDGNLSNGAGQYFHSGRTNGGDLRRALIAFNIAGAVPSGSTINSVTLTLYMSQTQAGNQTMRLHRVLAGWGEGTSNAGGEEGGGDSATTGDATWTYRFWDTQLWTTPGGQYNATMSGSTSVGAADGFYTWPSSAGMVADIQAWLNSPGSNFGWIIIGNESTNQTAKQFRSRQYATVSQRPALTITYTLPSGACCYANGSCQIRTPDQCSAEGGTYQGNGSNCTPNPCPQPTGACCFGSGECQMLTQTACQAQGGGYQGDNVPCSPNPCAQPTGACCFSSGACTVLTQTDCGSQGGTYQGNGTVCVPNPCPQPTGACCFANGSCLDLTLAACQTQSGTYQGNGTDCTPNPCPQPTGACCFNSGLCLVLTQAQCAAQSGTYQGDNSSCVSDLCPIILQPFVDPLPIPGVAQPTSGVPGGAASYTLAVTEFSQQFHQNLPASRVWGWGGSYPGPTILAGRDLPINVTWVNDLRDAQGNLRTTHYLPVDECLHGPDELGPSPRVVVHLHGGHVPFAADGYPENTILPGQQQTFTYPNNQLPATLWYHDHALGITRLNVYMGLAGFYLLSDPVEAALNLPSGEYEIGLAIQDRSFNPDGTLKYPAMWHEHFFGDFIVVNGKVWPYLNVKKGKYRFRLLDGCTSRTLTLTLSNGASFQMIGTDGGLLPAPLALTQMTLTPGERADVIIDFAAYPTGTEIVLTNSAPAPFPGSPGVGVIPNVMKFIVQNAAGDTDPVPTSLRPLEVLQEGDSIRSRDFELQRFTEACAGNRWLINGLLWHDITEFPRLDTTEVWRFINRSGTIHPMHMHLVMFQILDRQAFTVVDDEIVPVGAPVPPPPSEAGWKDTARADPQMITRVIARFEHYTGLYPYHCHILEHEDHEMMRQFESLPACPEDCADHDGDVDVTDLLELLAAWGPSTSMCDLDGDGDVDVSDLLDLLAAWGACPVN